MITDNDVKKLKQTFTTDDQLNGKIDSLRDEIHQDMRALFTEFKSEIFDRLDPIVGEIQKNREEREVTSFQVADHEDRIEKIEKTIKLS